MNIVVQRAASSPMTWQYPRLTILFLLMYADCLGIYLKQTVKHSLGTLELADNQTLE